MPKEDKAQKGYGQHKHQHGQKVHKDAATDETTPITPEPASDAAPELEDEK